MLPQARLNPGCSMVRLKGMAEVGLPFNSFSFLFFLMSKENVSDAQGREWCEAVSALPQEMLLILGVENGCCLGMVVI